MSIEIIDVESLRIRDLCCCQGVCGGVLQLNTPAFNVGLQDTDGS